MDFRGLNPIPRGNWKARVLLLGQRQLATYGIVRTSSPPMIIMMNQFGLIEGKQIRPRSIKKQMAVIRHMTDWTAPAEMAKTGT